MALNGSGTYTPPAPQFPAIPNTIILSSDFNQIILDIATALSTAIFRDGQAAFTAQQSMGGFKLTNLANGANPQDATTVLQVFTNPTFTASTTDGVKVTGSAVTLSVTTLKFAGSSAAELPANTSIGNVSAAEIAVLDGLTASTAELNILDGATVSTAELNILDGVTVTAAELNRLAGITSNVQTQLDGKAYLDSPAFIGAPTAPTPGSSDDSAALATTAFVKSIAFTNQIPKNRLFFFGQV